MKQSLLLCIAAMFFGGCAQFSVRVESEEGTDIASLKRYAWQPRTDDEKGDVRINQERLDREVVRSVDLQLSKRGYTPAAPGEKPDLLVHFTAEIDERFNVIEDDMQRSIEEPVGGEPTLKPALSYNRNEGWRTGADDSASEVHDYIYGKIEVELLDAATKQRLWRSVTKGEVFPNRTPEKRRELMDTMFSKAFVKLPQSR